MQIAGVCVLWGSIQFLFNSAMSERPVKTEDFVKTLDLRRNQAIIVILLLTTAALLRLPSLTLNSLWADELWVANLVSKPFETQLAILWNETLPPLFYWLVWLWSLSFGTSEFVLRLLPALIGIVTVPIAFLLFKRLFGSFTGLAVAVLILFLPAHIYYSQELRTYSFSFLLAVLLTAALFHYLSDPSAKQRWALAATCAALFGTHYVSFFYILSVLFIGGVWIGSDWRTRLKKALSLSFTVLLLVAPFLPHFFSQSSTMKHFWPPPVSLRRVGIMMGFLFQYQISLAVIYLLLITVAMVSARAGKDKVLSSKIWAAVVLSILPISGVIGVSWISPNTSLLIPRIMLVFAPSILLLAAMGLPDKRLSTMILVLCSTLSIWWLYSSAFYVLPVKSDFRGVTQEISRLEKEHENILLISLDSRGKTFESHYGYYFDMFGVRSDILYMHGDMSEEAVLGRIRRTAILDQTNTLVVFSMHDLVLTDVLEICDKHFRKEYEKTFVSPAHFGHTFLASYCLDLTGVDEEKGSDILGIQNP